jgi:hypothetical protein
MPIWPDRRLMIGLFEVQQPWLAPDALSGEDDAIAKSAS